MLGPQDLPHLNLFMCSCSPLLAFSINALKVCVIGKPPKTLMATPLVRLAVSGGLPASCLYRSADRAGECQTGVECMYFTAPLHTSTLISDNTAQQEDGGGAGTAGRPRRGPRH